MTSSSIRSFVWCTLAILSIALRLTLAQTPTAAITGIVTDSSGAVIVGAQITVMNTDTGIKRETASNDSGNYTIPLLNPGNYIVSASKEGFRPISRSGITLVVDQSARIDFAMELGSVSESVEIHADVPLVDSEKSSLGSVVENRQIANLPLNGGYTTNLAYLVPGVLPGANTNNTGDSGRLAINFWINGGRGDQNDVFVDGVALTVPELNPDYEVPLLPQVDSVQEFKVHTNSLPAEFGRTEGGVVEYVYKSGTNRVHGSAFDYLRNSVLDSNNFFSNSKGLALPAFRRNQFGGTFSGPVVIPRLFNGRDKLFIFVGYYGLRQGSQTVSSLTVPTALQRAGDFSQTRVLVGGVCQPVNIFDPASTQRTASGGFVRTQFEGNVISKSALDPVGLKAASYFPLPNGAGAACNGLNNYNFSGTSLLAENQPDGRLDFYPSVKDRFFLRMTARRQQSDTADVYGTLGRTNNPKPENANLGDSAAFSYTRTLSPNLIAEFRMGFGRIQTVSAGTGAGTDPKGSNFEMASALGWTGSAAKFIDQLGRPLGFPAITSSGYAGLGSAFPFSQNSGTGYQWAGSVTKIHGAHTIKAGADFRIGQATGPNGNNSNGFYTFTPSFTQGPNPLVAASTSGNSIASLLVGLGTGGATINPREMNSNHYLGAFVQDDFRVTKKLVVNIGLRYDVETGRTDRFNQLSWFDFNAPSPLANLLSSYGKIYGPNQNSSLVGGLVFPGVNGNPRNQFNTDWNNLGPRVGIAYSPNSKTVFRMGYGILYEPYIGRAEASGSAYIGFNSTTAWASSLDGLTPYNRLSNPFPNGLVNPPGSTLGLLTQIGGNIGTNGNSGREGAIDRGAVVAYTQQWNITIQRALPGNISLELAYTGQKGTHLPDGGGFQLDQLPPQDMALGNQLLQSVPNPFYGTITTGPLSATTTTLGQLLRPYPQFTNVLDWRPAAASSIYHAGQFQVTKRFSHGVQFSVAYTKGKSIDDSSNSFDFRPDVTGTDSGALGGSGVHQNVYNRAADRSVSLSDIAQRLAISYVVDLPFGHGRAIGAGWNRPLNAILGGWQVNGITTFQSGFPLAIEAASNTAQAFSDDLRPNGSGDAALPSDRPLKDKLVQWFNTKVFSQPQPFTFGNLARTLPNVRGDGLKNFDFSLFKNFDVSKEGAVKAEFRGEFFNLFNHPTFALPNQYYGLAAFGTVSSQLNSPRQIQFALKILF